MHGIREDIGRGQVPFKSPQGSKLKRDLYSTADSIIHFNVTIIFTITSKICCRGVCWAPFYLL